MSLDTQNQFTREEEELMSKITQTLHKSRDHELISNAVKSKIASTNFVPAVHTPIPRWKYGIYTGGSLLIVAFLAFFFINNNRTARLSQSHNNSNNKVETNINGEQQLAIARKDSFRLNEYNTQTTQDGNLKINQGTINQKDKGALAGLKGDNKKNPELNEGTLSFFEEHNYDPKADIKKFKADLRIALEKTDISFKDKSNRDEVISFITENMKGIDSDKIPVEYYISAKVDKRFPGSLKLSLRYKYEKGRMTNLQGETINKIFYDRVKSRVINLINAKYKP